MVATTRPSRLAPDARRQAIIAAVVPLLASRGPAVTSAEIAEAAGIAQGTIFHAFGDKHALIRAAVTEVMDVSELVAAVEALVVIEPLDARLAACVDLVVAALERMIPIVTKCGAPDDLAIAQHPVVRLQGAIVRLLEPDAATLVRPPAQLAAVFFGLCGASAQQASLGRSGAMPSSYELVELFLDGVCTRRIS